MLLLLACVAALYVGELLLAARYLGEARYDPPLGRDFERMIVTGGR